MNGEGLYGMEEGRKEEKNEEMKGWDMKEEKSVGRGTVESGKRLKWGRKRRKRKRQDVGIPGRQPIRVPSLANQ